MCDLLIDNNNVKKRNLNNNLQGIIKLILEDDEKKVSSVKNSIILEMQEILEYFIPIREVIIGALSRDKSKQETIKYFLNDFLVGDVPTALAYSNLFENVTGAVVEKFSEDFLSLIKRTINQGKVPDSSDEEIQALIGLLPETLKGRENFGDLALKRFRRISEDIVSEIRETWGEPEKKEEKEISADLASLFTKFENEIKNIRGMVNKIAETIIEHPQVRVILQKFAKDGQLQVFLKFQSGYHLMKFCKDYALPDGEWNVENLVRAMNYRIDDDFKELGKWYTGSLLKSMFTGKISNLNAELKRNVNEILRLNEYLKDNEEKIEKFAKAPDDAPLGKIAFGQKRNDVPAELDTEHEKELFSKLTKHYRGDKILDAETAQEIENYLKNNWYNDVFVETKEGVLYRGMRVSLDWLKDVIEIKENKESGTEDVTWTFSPHSGGSSWTTDLQVAKRFANSPPSGYSKEGKTVSIVLHAKKSDNPDSFVDSEVGLYKIQDFNAFSSEKEQIALGKIKISKIDWSIEGFYAKE